MEIEIKKKIDTDRIVTDLNTVDEMIGNCEYELLENTCEEAALIITELVYRLRNTKEALNKYMNGEKNE